MEEGRLKIPPGSGRTEGTQAVRFSRIILGQSVLQHRGSRVPIQASLGISQTLLFGAFTIGLLVSGAAWRWLLTAGATYAWVKFTDGGEVTLRPNA